MLLSAMLKVEPAPKAIYWKHDVFNNSICYLEWPEALRTKRLSIVSTLDMTHHPDGQPLPVFSLDATAETFPFSYAAHEIPDLARLANDPAIADLVQRRDVVGLLGNPGFQRVLTRALAPTPNAG